MTLPPGFLAPWGRGQGERAASAAENRAQDLQRFAYIKSWVGEVLLWECWLRHEVPMNMPEEERISASVNCGWE